uniref:Uncharacterized protein n=1 Tax=Caenorhabditis tropicalis TaxID=1561998 RepID=A0A1I7UHR7_9PELO
MPVADSLILFQNLFLFFIVVIPALISCKGKKAAKKNSKGSAETAERKSKSPSAEVASSQAGGTKEEAKKEGANESKEGDKKDEEKKDEEKKDDEKKEPSKEATSQKPFPVFEMKEIEVDKKEKIKKGFYQQKSDEDDTLEKVDSLHVEQSEKTKRSQKKKNKK